MRELSSHARIPLAITVVTVVAAWMLGGPATGLVVALLAVLEISISFDNAIVNATVLKKMTPRWQQIFVTWGILIAVFGMRLIFPIVIVAVASGLGFTEVVDQAINNPDLYAKNLEEANPVIAAFGGTFLLMVCLGYFLDPDKDAHWVGPVERGLGGLGRIDSIVPAIAGATVLLVSQLVASSAETDVLLAGLAGMVIYLFVSGIAARLEPTDDDEDGAEHVAGSAGKAAIQIAGKAGFASFLYLELLDASFSFDGVIGAFAISKDIFVIAAGLGLGAIYIRTLTVYLVRQGTLAEYRYLENGAHWAIGALAVLLFVGIEHHTPEVVTGLIGAGVIIVALWSSIRANQREAAIA